MVKVRRNNISLLMILILLSQLAELDQILRTRSQVGDYDGWAP